MKKTITIWWILGLISLLISTMAIAAADCPDCKEVAKGKIPVKFLDKSVKTLPNGIAIWDVEEALPVLRAGSEKHLWVDTRPKSFFTMGTVKGAINLVCDQDGVPVPKNHGPELTPSSLLKAMKKVDDDISKVTVVFFCQGPECHRSYNAALRSVEQFDLPLKNIVWFRDGYPILEKTVMNNPKLKKRMNLYLQGDMLNL